MQKMSDIDILLSFIVRYATERSNHMKLKYYIQKSLIELGLTQGEAKVYFEILKKPGIDAQTLQKSQKFSTAGIYKILGALIDKGFVTAAKKASRSAIYFSTPLAEISKKIDKKERTLARISGKLKELSHLNKIDDSDSSISNDQLEIYEANDLTNYYLNIPYKIDDFIWCIGSFEAVVNFFGQEVEQEFINNRIKKGKQADAIIFDNSDFSKNLAGRDIKEKRETKFIHNGQYPLEFSYLFGDTYLNFYRDVDGAVKVLKAQSEELARAKNIQYQMLWRATESATNSTF